ncbi:MAG TPA: UDP-N-acetylmuramoyl-L-alanyl-D-glutamate--2,6-diaminopimelate ligase [Bacteroidales bacterium]|nr:UDP-N-acetylmuramoyl-L-alanyl-D-glutamate--2,6-diaminopimelate ligase [Bacteroidales bacterium]
MIKLSNILKDIEIIEKFGSTDISVRTVIFDSRKADKEVLFVAVKGTQVDGHQFILQAIKKGCAAIVAETVEKEIIDRYPTVAFIKVRDTHEALGIIASNFYARPSEKLSLTGVTGTNGKTTIVTLLFSLFQKLGYNTGMLSTIENKINEKTLAATHTTPDPVSLNHLLKQMVDEGVSHCFMEVSSHAIHQKRIAGLKFAGGIFTNITQDHLDYHETFKNYIYAKKAFFDYLPAQSWALTNLDDKNGKTMLQNTNARQHSFALKTPATFKGKVLSNSIEGLQMNINRQEVWFSLVGNFNAYNILAVYGAATLLGADPESALSVLSGLKAAEGRFEVISGKGVKAIVDYAHTPDALKNVLETIDSTRTRKEQVITVVGAGGNRDKGKRPLMARIAAKFSDKLILTSDNPRYEDPERILEDMAAGLDEEQKKKLLTIASRREAIKTACMLASAGDILLVAGKGHEKYQEIKGERQHFDDKEQLNEFLK